MENLNPVTQLAPTVSGFQTTISGQETVDQRAYDIEPTKRQQLAYQIFMEHGGKLSMYQSMIRAGYSHAYAKNSDKLQDTRGWQILIEQFMPDEVLLDAHLKLLNAKRIRKTFKRGELEEEIEEEDTFAISKGLDMGYKLKGKYAAEKKDIKGTLTLARLVEEAAADKDHESQN